MHIVFFFVVFFSGHPRSVKIKQVGWDLQNQQLEPDTRKTRKIQKAPLAPKKQGFEEIPWIENAGDSNAEKADTKMLKMLLTGFIVTGFR